MNLSDLHLVKTVVLTFGTALIISSCGSTSTSGTGGMSTGGPGSGGGGGNSPNAATTLISTNGQGAQAASSTVTAAVAMGTFGAKLSGMADTATATIASLPKVYIPVTFDCASRLPVIGGSTSTPDSITVVQDFSGLVTATMNLCASGTTSVSGVMTAASSGGTTTLSLGSGSAPLTIWEYTAAGSGVLRSGTNVIATVTYNQTGTTDTLGVTGTVDYWDGVKHSHDLYSLTNVSIVAAKSTTVIGADNYDVSAVTMNGAVVRTAFVSDTVPTVKFTESGTLANFAVVLMTPAAGSAAVYEYLNIGGEFTVASTPSVCIDGDFVIATNIDLQIDPATGLPVAGELTINGNTVAIYNADGSVTVAVGGTATTYPASTLTTLCPV